MSSVIYPTSQPVIPMPSGNNSLNQIMTLLQEIVSAAQYVSRVNKKDIIQESVQTGTES
ncbi:23842_t:CDS:2 [Gigaspora rosea]|nr:23842_t:CDS:2 [Gigaspora rosea]